VSCRCLLLPAIAVLAATAAFPIYGCKSRSAPSAASNSLSSNGAFPTGLAADSNGNIYVVVHKQNRILKVSPDRRVTVIAGNGLAGFSGDGGPAYNASLDEPLSLALDSAGNIFIADTNNNRIRRVDGKTSIITTVAGNGSFMGGGTGKLATADILSQPVSVAVDADENLYISQNLGIGIKRVDAITHLTSEVIGAGLPGSPSAPVPASGPFWLALDTHGVLFYSDPSRNIVAQVDSPENRVQIIAGAAVCGMDGDGGAGIAALLCFPEGLSVLGDKEVLIADTGNNRIRRVDLSTGIITTVAGNGKADYTGDGGPAIKASLNGPMGETVNETGDIYIADTGNNCIRLLHAATGMITTWLTSQDLALSATSAERK
jgi:hypothetical protein